MLSWTNANKPKKEKDSFDIPPAKRGLFKISLPIIIIIIKLVIYW